VPPPLLSQIFPSTFFLLIGDHDRDSFVVGFSEIFFFKKIDTYCGNKSGDSANAGLWIESIVAYWIVCTSSASSILASMSLP